MYVSHQTLLHSNSYCIVILYVHMGNKIITVDSPSKGWLGTIAFVLCMEMSFTWKVLLEYHTSINLTFDTKQDNNESATIKKIMYNE